MKIKDGYPEEGRIVLATIGPTKLRTKAVIEVRGETTKFYTWVTPSVLLSVSDEDEWEPLDTESGTV